MLVPDTSNNVHWRASSEEYALELARQEAAQAGGSVFKKAQHSTPSMLGTVPRRGYYYTIPKEEYETGTPVVFKSPKGNGRLILHNVSATRPGEVFPKGTFNRNGDGWVPNEDVIGQLRKFLTW